MIRTHKKGNAYKGDFKIDRGYLRPVILDEAGAGGTGAVTMVGGQANYAGGKPTFTPASGFGMAVDTSNARLWIYYSGAWH